MTTDSVRYMIVRQFVVGMGNEHRPWRTCVHLNRMYRIIAVMSPPKATQL
jgi:hypothetical protein